MLLALPVHHIENRGNNGDGVAAGSVSLLESQEEELGTRPALTLHIEQRCRPMIVIRTWMCIWRPPVRTLRQHLLVPAHAYSRLDASALCG